MTNEAKQHVSNCTPIDLRVLSIWNSALVDLGEDPIKGFHEDSKAAKTCRQRWGGILDAVLRAHPWNFAMAEAELDMQTVSKVWKWDCQYQLPTDFLRLVKVYGEELRVLMKWEVQGHILLCNEDAPLFLTYVRKVTDPADFDSLFTEAIIARMKATLAYPICGSTDLAQVFWDEYREKILEARGVDAREGCAGSVVPERWITAKLGR